MKAKTIWKSIKHYIRSWAIALSILVIAVIYIFHSQLSKLVPSVFGQPEQPYPLLLFSISIVIVILSAIWQDQGETEDELKSHISENLGPVTIPNTYTLERCVDDFDQSLNRIDSGDMIIINHIGLDMHIAWRHIHDRILETHAHADIGNKNMDYRLLLVDYGKAEGIEPASLSTMRGLVKSSLDRIKKTLEFQPNKFSNLKLTVRLYAELPIIHGLSANKPENIHYLCFCRWNGQNYQDYEWGEGRYHIIKGTSHSRSRDRDLINIFDSYFEHLWHKYKARTEYKYPK